MLEVRYLPTLPSLLETQNTPFIHRDLSWLQFNERVLAEARQATNPLLERIKFLGISASNLDEFFMIRIASLQRSIAFEAKSRFQNEKKLRQLLRIRSTIEESVVKFGAKQNEVFDLLSAELQDAQVSLVSRPQPQTELWKASRRLFEEKVLSHLPAPEPFSVKLLSQVENVQIAILLPNNFWVRIPRALPPVYASNENGHTSLFFLDQLCLMHLPAALGLTGVGRALRITRDCDFDLDFVHEDSASIPDIVHSRIRGRDLGKAMRVQYLGTFLADDLDRIRNALKLSSENIYPAPNSLCIHGLFSAARLVAQEASVKPTLLYPAIEPFQIEMDSIFDDLKESDCLLHHPYDSFDSYLRFMKKACEDPQVVRIEQTIYRTDSISPMLETIKKAAKKKSIRFVIELRARFDELNNLKLAEELRQAGVEVSFGFGRLKLHAKVALVTRIENGEERLYTHLSTGNYNATTARFYTDLAVLSGNQEIGKDARKFFDSVSTGKIPLNFNHLVVAPTRLHRRLHQLIDAETRAAEQGLPARVVAKVNALVDQPVIEKLYQASQAGVQVDLIVRGACSLVPGVTNLSENIRVISLVDRYLEHSRIYYFMHSRQLYLSSADWMPRNFFSRLEIAFPVLDARLYQYIEQVVIPTYLKDNVKAKELTPQGTWKKRAPGGKSHAVRAQFVFQDFALNEYKGTPLA